MLLRNIRYTQKIDGLKSVLACRFASTDYLTAGLKDLNIPEHKSKNQPVKENPMLALRKQIEKSGIKPNELTNRFLDAAYPVVTRKQLAKSQTFWNAAKITLDYVVGSIDQIPDIKYETLLEERLNKIEQDPQANQDLIHSKKTFGIQPQLLKPLPEILFLGHTNAGKSSIINNIFTKKSKDPDQPEAFVSRRAGFTKTLNCYNIGQKLRLIDSPGYGEFGEEKQGQAVLDYLSTRNLLRRVFLVVDGKQGFRDDDLQIIDHLISLGIPFEIVLTKIDTIISKNFSTMVKENKGAYLSKTDKKVLIDRANMQVVNHYQRMLDNANISSIKTLPKILFNNNVTNQYLNDCYGNKQLRYYILESCGLIE